ncbi:hypothetical protein ACULMH_05335 [Xanthomonas arboricola pv. corylina]|nr:hypothetical protein [Xanthomonas arboricola]NJC32359.1 hypothetical protein [Xanthomonas arboricola]
MKSLSQRIFFSVLLAASIAAPAAAQAVEAQKSALILIEYQND